MRLDVKKNAKRNIIVGVFNKTILLILPFLTKMIINNTLGSEYLGLNSLFASILSVLALSELGFSSALVYHMYKPIAEEDQKAINALLNLYKKVYFYIGLVIVGLGVLFLPFLPKVISGGYPDGINIYILYLLQLSNTAVSYFLFGYKQSLLVAHQREDINSIINLITQAGMQVLQIVLLVKTSNYYLYVLCMPLFTVANNLWIAYFTKKMYPEAKCEGKLDDSVLGSIKKLVAGSFVQKACATTRNSLDSICISAFVGLTLTGIYNNYYTIFNGVTTMVAILASSITAGIGNHVVVKSKEENLEELKKLDALYMMLSGWCTACLLCLSQPFMRIWMGDKMLFPILSVVNMCIYFYTLKLGDIRGVYYSATGMWWEMRYRSIFETVGNLVLNIVLGYSYGINGIIAATTISLLVFNFIWGASIVFRNYFGIEKIWTYYSYHLKAFINTVIVCIVTYYACGLVKAESMVVELVIKMFICCILGAGLMILLNLKNKSFKAALKMVRR